MNSEGKPEMAAGVTDSQFYMWRAVFALAHADDVVTDEEVRFMAEALQDIPFSAEQQAQLNKDVSTPQNIEAMFGGISDVQDQAQFFQIARDLVHIDGDYGAEEQAVMLKLKELHLQAADLDELVGQVQMELEDEPGGAGAFAGSVQNKSFKDRVYSYRDTFLKQRFKD